MQVAANSDSRKVKSCSDLSTRDKRDRVDTVADSICSLDTYSHNDHHKKYKTYHTSKLDFCLLDCRMKSISTYIYTCTYIYYTYMYIILLYTYVRWIIMGVWSLWSRDRVIRH